MRRGFELNEVDSIYVEPTDRFVVSLIASYGAGADVFSAKEAAAGLLSLTTDENSGGTHWCVYDRFTGETHILEQNDFDPESAPFRT